MSLCNGPGTGHIPVANCFSLTAVLLFRQHFVVPEFNFPNCGSYTKDAAENCKFIPSWAGPNCTMQHLQQVLAGLKRSLSPVLLCPCNLGPNSLTFSLPSSSHAGCSCTVMRRQAKEACGYVLNTGWTVLKLGKLQKTESSEGTCKENKGIISLVGSVDYRREKKKENKLVI